MVARRHDIDVVGVQVFHCGPGQPGTAGNILGVGDAETAVVFLAQFGNQPTGSSLAALANNVTYE